MSNRITCVAQPPSAVSSCNRVIARDLKPLHDRVLVQRFPTQNTFGSIVIPQTAREKALRGIVVAAGPGKKDRDGIFHETMVKPGDEVLFTASVDVPYADLVHEGDLVMMAEADILGILPKLKGEEDYRGQGTEKTKVKT